MGKRKRDVVVGHELTSGRYLVGDIERFFESKRYERLKGKVGLILTSPPFPLNHKKSYGNLEGDDYLDWIKRIAPKLAELLAPDGSLVVEMGNAWEKGRPVQSLLHLKALMALV